jgi:hypothetical protein
MSTTFENLGTRRITVRLSHSWHEAYASAMRESDPDKFIGSIEYAISTIERRHSQWGTDPGTPTELTALQKCISALKRRMKQEHLRRHGAIVSTA